MSRSSSDITSSHSSQKKHIKRITVKMKRYRKHQASFLDHPTRIALHYGFAPYPRFKISREYKEKASRFKEARVRQHTKKQRRSHNPCFVAPEEKIALLRHHFNKKYHHSSFPQLIHHPGTQRVQKTHKKKKQQFRLDIVGSSRSMAEALLIQTAVAILKEEGFSNLTVEINSIGDKESIQEFERELSAYYRSYFNALDPECQETLKDDCFEVLKCPHECCKPLKEEAPQSISFLKEADRKHFFEVLEYLETLDIPYNINNSLVGNRYYSSQTVFEIKAFTPSSSSKDSPEKTGEFTCLAHGTRYDTFSKKIGLKTEIPSVGMSFSYPVQNADKEEKRGENKTPAIKTFKSHTPKTTSDNSSTKNLSPRCSFIQLGFMAKLKSLPLLEELRQANIPVHHNLTNDRFFLQHNHAKKLRFPYLIIMGQKEAMENTVLVRDMETRAQESVPLSQLSVYLKKRNVA